jgi:hypothetical protein
MEYWLQAAGLLCYRLVQSPLKQLRKSKELSGELKLLLVYAYKAFIIFFIAFWMSESFHSINVNIDLRSCISDNGQTIFSDKCSEPNTLYFDRE